MINGPDEKHILKAREKQENWWHKKDYLVKITLNIWLPMKKGPNNFIFWLECFLQEKTSHFQEFQPTMSDDIYNRWWLHVRCALSNSRIIAKRDVTHKEINLYHSRIVDPVWKVCESPVFIWTHMLSVLDSHTCWFSNQVKKFLRSNTNTSHSLTKLTLTLPTSHWPPNRFNLLSATVASCPE